MIAEVSYLVNLTGLTASTLYDIAETISVIYLMVGFASDGIFCFIWWWPFLKERRKIILKWWGIGACVMFPLLLVSIFTEYKKPNINSTYVEGYCLDTVKIPHMDRMYQDVCGDYLQAHAKYQIWNKTGVMPK